MRRPAPTINARSRTAYAALARAITPGLAPGLACVLPFILALGVGCSGLTDPPLPSTSQAFVAPLEYRAWWSMAEICSQRTGSLDAVKWYVVPNTTVISLDGSGVSGSWSAATHRIVLAQSAMHDGRVVRHEMLHSLLRVGGHPRSEFLGKCAGVVACQGRCVVDGGPAPAIDPAWPAVSPDSLDVSVEVSPGAPSASVNNGWFTLVVSARNPATHGILVLLPPAPGGPPGAFSYAAQSRGVVQSFDDRAWDSSITAFGPGETKKEVFDLVAGGDPQFGGVSTGQLVIRGGYGGKLSALQQVAVAP